MTPKKWMLAATLMLVITPSQAQREMKTINDNWEFRTPTEELWRSVNLPHTYNQDAYQQKDYYQGEGLYRRTLTLPEVVEGRRYYLKIDAANKAAEVSVNGKQVGSHAGGYSAFTFDITEYIQKDNLIEITVDNSRKDITPLSADFTFFGGIYRDVWLISTPAQHFNMANMGTDGIFITTPTVSEESGTLNIRSEVTNDGNENATLEVRNTIYAPDGELLQTLKRKLKLKAGETTSIESLSETIKNPTLWTPETPALYRVTTSLVNPKTGETLDERSHKIGFRWFAFDGNKGFSLNGKPYKLHGLNRHQDQAPMGIALDDEAHRRDIHLMKEIGCNFFRIAHYPQDDAILEMCDELGILVWEEIPIVNYVPDTPGYNENCERNFREMIRQHYNHTCVIAWGYMNEILLTASMKNMKSFSADQTSLGEASDNDPEFEHEKDLVLTLAKRLEAVKKEEDPNRVSVMAFHMSELYPEIGLNLVDVTGWNLYHGWYVGKLTDFDAFCEKQHRLYPDDPIIISEWGAGSDQRLHSNTAHAFDFSIEYQQTYVEHYLPFIENTEWICGSTYWNFIDFNVASREESMPRVNNKGLVYNNRIYKDVAYYFKAMWRKDIPVIYIASRDWETRTGKTGEAQTIKIYSNMPEVELFVNSQSVGRQKISNYHTLFKVALPEGPSTLVAKGIKDGIAAEDAMSIQFKSLPNLEQGDELAINIGSNCYFTSDMTQLTWLPDQPYTQGSWGYEGGTERSTTAEIHNTLDGPLYQTWREGDFSYKIDAPQGEYEIELLMADMTQSTSSMMYLLGKDKGDNTEGTTRFNISICGEEVESAFSPADSGHYFTAFKRRYIVQNESNQITIDLKALSGKPFLGGIKVRKL